nr:unnamed protein product [Callosobruchus chinensis]
MLFATVSQYLAIACLSALCIWYLDHRWKRRKWYSCSRNIPGPYALPIIGASYYLVKEISRAKWRRHRKIINPSFSQKMLHSFLPIMSAKSDELVKDLQSTVGNKIVPLYRIISRYSVELTFQTAMGVDMDLNSIESNLDEVIDKMIELLTERIQKIWYHLDIIWYFSGQKKHFQYYKNRLRGVVEAVVKKKMEGQKSKEPKTEIDVATDHGNFQKSAAFLDSLMANTDLDESEIKDEVNTFIIAATDTTAKALTSLFTIFGIYPDIQEKVRKEIIDKVGLEGEPTPEDLNQLEYTERVIKEVLRLFPPSFMISRYASGDIDLGDNITVPEGVSITIPLLHIHRSGEFWEDPLKFDPDRFLPDAAKRHPLSYLGFSHGPRNCIGKYQGIAIARPFPTLNKKMYLVLIKKNIKSTDIINTSVVTISK